MAKRLTFTGSSLRRALAVAAMWCFGIMSLLAAPAGAQTAPAPTLEILSVEHDPAGALILALRASGDRAAQIEHLSVFVDDVPIALDLGRRDAASDLALMLVIDTSGSMEGAPMVAAREAARALIAQLSVNDRVSVVSFADAPLWQVGLTRDHGLALSVLDYLVADGSTALYDAVALAGRELSLVPEERRAVVLLSDGQDFGGVSATPRATTIEDARGSGATFYAVGLGPESDAEYLVELADATGGEFYPMRDGHDANALTALFEGLGGRLGASETYTLPVGVMAQGSHELKLRAVVDGEPASATFAFEASNEGLLQPSVERGVTPESPIRVSFGAFAPSSGLTFEVRAGDDRYGSSASGEIELDPWRLAPGPQELTLVAYAAGGIAAQEAITVDVPQLTPTVTVVVGPEGIEAHGRAQHNRGVDDGSDRPVLVAVRGGVEVGRSQSGSLMMPRADQPTTFELRSADGSVLATSAFTPPVVVAASAEAAGGGVPVWGFALVPVGLAGAVVVGRRLRRRPLSVAERVLRPMSQAKLAYEQASLISTPQLVAVDGEPVQRAPKDAPLGTVMVVDASGHRTAVPLTARPLTVGSSLACDIVLGDPLVRGKHLRLTAIQRDEVQVHVLPERGARPHLRAYQAEEEWLIAHHGEQIDIGSYSLQILPAGAVIEESEAVG